MVLRRYGLWTDSYNESLLDNSFVDYTGNAIFWDLVTYGNEIQVTGVSLESKQNVLNNPIFLKRDI